MPRIQIDLLKDRTRPGVLRFYSDDMEMQFRCACLGKADNAQAAKALNPTRDSIKPDGDTPTGTYRVIDIRRKDATTANLHTYGPNPIIHIEGTGGSALAAKINGRVGLAIHGGELSEQNKLRPTYGCIRVSNSNMASLNMTFERYGAPGQVIVEELTQEFPL